MLKFRTEAVGKSHRCKFAGSVRQHPSALSSKRPSVFLSKLSVQTPDYCKIAIPMNRISRSNSRADGLLFRRNNFHVHHRIAVFRTMINPDSADRSAISLTVEHPYRTTASRI
jgi:hypothetical protein